jgi:putative Mn2+ efflux pump MntP
LTLAGAIIYLFSVFVTKGLAGKVFSQKIFGRFAPRISNNRFLMLLIGSFVYVLLRSIPFLGAIIGFMISLLGLGAAWLVWNENKKMKRQPVENEVIESGEEINQDSNESISPVI